MLKYGGITAGVFCAMSIVYSMLANKSQTVAVMNNNVQNYVGNSHRIIYNNGVDILCSKIQVKNSYS